MIQILIIASLNVLSFNVRGLTNQKGENKQDGVLVLVRHTLNYSRFPCCIDVQGVESIRICGVYTPDSKTAILI